LTRIETIYGYHRPVMASYGGGRRALTATITGLGGLVVAATTCLGPFIAAETGPAETGPTGPTIVRTRYGQTAPASSTEAQRFMYYSKVTADTNLDQMMQSRIA
jgi:hypothetical protein